MSRLKCLVYIPSIKNLRSFQLLSKSRTESDFIVVSDDNRVLESLKEHNSVISTQHFLLWDSYFSVSTDVIKIIDELNLWFTKIANEIGIEPDLIKWFKNPEGGITDQRVQDLTLLIASISKKIQSMAPDEVFLFESSSTIWETTLLEDFCNSRDIKVTVKYDKFGRIKSRLEYKVISFIKDVYFLLNLLRVKLFSSHKDEGSLEGKILFQLCSSTDRHLSNVSHLMQALHSRKHKVVALCWNVSEPIRFNPSSSQIRDLGLEAINLEKYINLLDIYESYRQRRLLRKVLSNSIKELDNFVSYKGLEALTDHLKDSLHHTIEIDFIQRMHIDASIKNLLNKAGIPLAVKTWGVNEFFEGIALWKNIKDLGKCLRFNYWIGLSFDPVYTFKDEDLHLFLASDTSQKDQVKKGYGLKEDDIKIVGHTRHIPILQFKEIYTSEESKKILKIRDNKSLVIGFDAGMVKLGEYTSSEQSLHLNLLIDTIRKYSDIQLIVKEHPRQGSSNFLKEIILSENIDQLKLLKRTDSAYHFLNSVDILVTKFSTIGLEGMYFNVPVISCNFLNEEKLKIYGEAADYLLSPEEMILKLKQICSDKEFYDKWRSDQLEVQRRYISNQLLLTQDEYGSTCALHIESLLKDL